MGTHLITGYAGKAHIKSNDQGIFNSLIFGAGEFVFDRWNKFSAQIISNNKIRINDGIAVVHGRHIQIDANTYEEVDIINGTQGSKRNDLIVLRYSKNATTDIESVSVEVITGVPVATNPEDPEYSKGNIIDGDLIHDMPLYRVPLDGLNVGKLVPLFTVIPDMPGMLGSKADGLVYDEDSSMLQLKAGNEVLAEVEISGGASRSTINVTTSEFKGQEVTLSVAGGNTTTGTFSDDGVCVFKVKDLGVYTIACGEVSETVTVSVYGALYTVDLNSAPKATINVTTAEAEFFGQTVTCTDGSETLTGAFSDSGECTFRVKNKSTYTISCGEYSTTVNVTDLEAEYTATIEAVTQLVNYTMLYDAGDECTDVTGGWSIDGWTNKTSGYTIVQGTKNSNNLHVQGKGSNNTIVSFATQKAIDLSEFSGLGVVIEKNTTVGWFGFMPTKVSTTEYLLEYVKNLENGANLIPFSISETRYMFLTINGVTTNSATFYNIFLVKEDNWQEWISKAGLSTDTYTTLDSVLSDATALDTLMNSEAAVNYMLMQCTGTVMAGCIQSQTALDAIADSDYFAKIYANVHWKKFLDMVDFKPRTYLYNMGDENIDITGGWAASEDSLIPDTWVNVVPTKEDSYLYLNPNDAELKAVRCSHFSTVNNIDLTDFSKIKMIGDFTSLTTTAGYDNAYLFIGDNSLLNDSKAYSTLVDSNGNNLLLELDISEITESYILTIAAIRQQSVKIYKIWLE